MCLTSVTGAGDAYVRPDAEAAALASGQFSFGFQLGQAFDTNATAPAAATADAGQPADTAK